MVLELSIVENEEPEVNRAYIEHLHDLFTIHVNTKRILTVLTDNDYIASKWLTEVLRSKSTNTKPPLPGAPTTFPPNAIFVGLVAEEESPFFGPKPYNSTNNCFDLLTLCVGSHCLMLELHGGYYRPFRPYRRSEPPFEDSPKLVKDFFQNPRVVVLGTDMAKTTERLEARHGIVIRNAVDLNQLAVNGMQRHDLDLARYSFEKLVTTVLGNDYDVIRPERVYWHSREKFMYSTVDAYLRLLMCFKLLESIDGPRESSSSKKKNKHKKKKMIHPKELANS